MQFRYCEYGEGLWAVEAVLAVDHTHTHTYSPPSTVQFVVAGQITGPASALSAVIHPREPMCDAHAVLCTEGGQFYV
jgi:hypothetical protein